jgi:hypothetical protein
MTTKQQILAEIERRIHNIESCPFIIGEFGQQEREIGEVMAYKYLLSFLDTLPDDELISNDLKEAAEEYRQGEVDSGCDYIDDSDGDSLYHSACLTDAFIAGAEWDRGQMMKEAKDGYVSGIIIHNDGDEEHYAVTYPNGKRPHSIMDKVKIIIL